MNTSLRTVLVFAYECAPYNRRESTIGAQRPAQFAKHLPHFGWRAIVLCCHREERGIEVSEPLEHRIVRALAESTPSDSLVIPTPSVPYDGILDRAWRALTPESGVTFPGRDALRKPLTALRLRWGDYSQNWQPVARQAAEVIARHLHCDACIGEHSPDAGIHLARWFADRYRVPWIADFRDPILQPFSPVLRRLYAPTARAILSSASATVSVTPYWSELARFEFQTRAATIPNGFDEEEFPHRPPASSSCLTIAYAGNLWPEMRPHLFFEGLALLKERLGAARFQKGIRFVYRGLASDQLQSFAKQAGVAEVADCEAYVPREQALEILISSDVLLLFGIPPDRTADEYLARGIYPGKFFEYLGARRPIICVPGDAAQLDEILERTAAGVVLETPSAIAGWLTEAIAVRESGKPLPYEPNERERQRYSRRNLSGRLAALLNSVTGTENALLIDEPQYDNAVVPEERSPCVE